MADFTRGPSEGVFGWKAITAYEDTTTNLNIPIPGDYGEILIEPSQDVEGFGAMRFNNVSAGEYSYIDNSDSFTGSATEIQLGGSSSFLHRVRITEPTASFNTVGVSMVPATGGRTGMTTHGSCDDAAAAPIDSIQLIETSGDTPMKGRIYGRER